MTQSLEQLDNGLLADTTGGVKITKRRGAPWVKVPKLDKLEVPANLGKLKDEVLAQWWGLDLLEVLKEADFLTGFIEEFVSVASREALDRDILQRRLLLCLFGLGKNMGIKAVTDAGGHGESEQELRHVRRTFITKDNLRQAIVKVINATFEARNPEWCGPVRRIRRSSVPGNRI